jgi:RNA polymerase sigma-70 factor (ECF subfamily)
MDECQCVARAIAGDLSAFDLLVERYQRAVYNLAYRMLGNAADAEDAAQETFLRAFASLSSYQATRKFGTWLLSITSHWCIDRLRRRKVISLEFLQDISLVGGLSEGPEAEVMAREHEREVHRWLEMLPEAYRLIIVLRYWHDLSYNEIADVTGLPLSTVRMRLFRARRLLAAAHNAARQPSRPVAALAS